MKAVIIWEIKGNVVSKLTEYSVACAKSISKSRLISIVLKARTLRLKRF